MAITQVYSQSALSVSTTELSLVSGTSTLQTVTTAGIYQLWLDPVTNMAKGDEFLVKVYEKVLTGGTKRVVWSACISDAQSTLFVMPTLILMNGWDMTIQRTAGSDRAFDASIRKVA